MNCIRPLLPLAKYNFYLFSTAGTLLAAILALSHGRIPGGKNVC